MKFKCPYCGNKVKRWGCRQRTCGSDVCYKKHKTAMYFKDIEDHRNYRKEYESSAHGKKVRKQGLSKRKIGLDEMLNALKAKPCTDCGHIFPPVCMDFDHIRGKKIIKISTHRLNHRWENILKEIAKCELVCSNCHRIRTKKRREEKAR